jgi:hypothetical protein
MFDSDGNSPLEKLQYLDVMLQYLAEQHQELAEDQCNSAKMIEQLSGYLVDVSEAITSLYDNQKLLEIKLKELEK